MVDPALVKKQNSTPKGVVACTYPHALPNAGSVSLDRDIVLSQSLRWTDAGNQK